MKMKRLALVLLAWVAVAVQPLVAAPASPGAAGDPDVAARWKHFLATAELSDVMAAYAVLAKVSYDGDSIDPDGCGKNAAVLATAIERSPVSVALRGAAFLCAQASGDSAASEHALAELVALSRYALAGAGEFQMSRPIAVVAPVDADALVRSSGLEQLYDYYPDRWPQRYFPLVIAARDPQSGLERHLVFDYIDTQFQIAHEDDFAGYPYERIVLTRNYIEDDDGVLDSLDRKAVNEAMDGPADKRIGVLRAAAGRGGIEAAHAWLGECRSSRDPHCADGLVDVLLPLAEKQYAYPTVLLAMAYLEGIGVGKDPKAAWTLLDAADRHWRMGGAYECFARIWQDFHGDDQPLPAALDTRLAQAAASGNRFRERMGIFAKIHAKGTLSAGEIAFLADPRENWSGLGFGMLAEYEAQREHWPERRRWLVQAGQAGDADSLALLGADYWHGLHGEPQDHGKGRPLLQEGAQGGVLFAGRFLGWDAMLDGRWNEAEGWQLAPAMQGDEQAALNIAGLFSEEYPGVTGKLPEAIAIYRELADNGFASGRRVLATLALQGRGMPRDPVQARSWLLQDAEKGDPESMVQLGTAYAQGSFGKPDFAEAQRWLERALATGDGTARNEYGNVLYHEVATPEARARALGLWQQGADKGETEGRNNLAWALCVSAYPQEIDAPRGLALARALGSPDLLPAGYLDTLAACEAANGDYDRAAAHQQQVMAQVERQTRGLAAAEVHSRLKDFLGRLDLYRARKPYREAPKVDQSGASSPNHSVSLTSPATQ